MLPAQPQEFWIKHLKNLYIYFGPRSDRYPTRIPSVERTLNFSGFTFTVKLRVQVRFKRGCGWFGFYGGSRHRRSSEAVVGVKLMGKTRTSLCFLPCELLYGFSINSEIVFSNPDRKFWNMTSPELYTKVMYMYISIVGLYGIILAF